MVISRCCFAEAGTDFFISIAQTARLFLLRPIKFLIYGVVIAVPVVDAKAPSFFFWFCFFVCFCFHFFCRGREGLVHKYVPHVHHDYFSSFNQSDNCLWIAFAVLFVLASTAQLTK